MKPPKKRPPPDSGSYTPPPRSSTDLHIRLAPDINAIVENVARRNGLNKSQATRLIIMKYTEEEPRAGLGNNPKQTNPTMILLDKFSSLCDTIDKLEELVSQRESQNERHRTRLGRPGTTEHDRHVRLIESNQRSIKAMQDNLDDLYRQKDALVVQISGRKEEKPNE